MTAPMDTIHYVRLPKAMGARAEMVRMTYVLAGRPYRDSLVAFQDARATVSEHNPFKQFPFVVTADGKVVYQALAIMHHAAHGTSAWPSDPETFERALSVAMGAYDLYQHFGGFVADDAAAKQKFEEKRAPQFFAGLGDIYTRRKFAAGETPTFADCIAHQAITWCVRRNDVCRDLFAKDAALRAFVERFEAIPSIAAFMKRQADARLVDDAV